MYNHVNDVPSRRRRGHAPLIVRKRGQYGLQSLVLRLQIIKDLRIRRWGGHSMMSFLRMHTILTRQIGMYAGLPDPGREYGRVDAFSTSLTPSSVAGRNGQRWPP